MAIDSDSLLTKAEKAQKKKNLYVAYNLNSLAPRPTMSSPLSTSFYHNDTVESVVGKRLSFISCYNVQIFLNIIDNIRN
jgi:hypothetical protein